MALDSSWGETRSLFYPQSSLCRVVPSLRTPFSGRSFGLAGMGRFFVAVYTSSRALMTFRPGH